MMERSTWWAILGFCFGANCLGAPIDWPHLKLTRITNGFNEPVCITSARDGSGRLFIAERFGKIRVLVNGELQPEPFLDLSSKVDTEWHYSYGILSLAFPPDFAAKQYFYVHYTPTRDRVVLSRFHVPPGSTVAALDSEEVVATTYFSYESLSYGGHLAFGPDGYLYFGFGGYPNAAQQLDNAVGKIHRIDVESTTNGYVIPPDNPFAGNTTNRNEIWSWGLAQPVGFSIDRLTGDLYIVDHQGMRCEINFQSGSQKSGANYGYPLPEFAFNDPLATYQRYGAIPPVYTLSVEETYGVTGHLFQNPALPRMNYIYYMGQLNSGYLAGFARQGTNWVRQDFPEAVNPGNTFGEDESGRLYVASQYAGTIDLVEDSGMARPPLIYPPSGVANTSIATLSVLNPGGRIRYTTDGRDPQPGDPEVQSGYQLPIQAGSIIKAQVLRDDLLPSDVATATYTGLKVAYPVFTPGPGAITNPTSITITSATPGAVIRYTRNGTQPTTSSPVYTKPLVLTNAQVIYARAYRAGFEDSDLNGATYELARTAPPTFWPDHSPITNRTWVTLSCATPGATIRYTTNGQFPTVTSPLYTRAFRINGNTLLRIRAFTKGYLPSELREAYYALVPVATPVLDPPSGPVAYGSAVKITCDTPGAVLRYTTNGTTPTATSPIYTKPIPIYGTMSVLVRGYKLEHTPSEIAAEGYYLQYAKPPVFTPGEGPVKKYTPIIISAEPRLAQIRYTLDGTEPGPNSPLYRRPILPNGPVTISARVYAFGYNPSDVAVTFFGWIEQESAIVQTVAGTGQPGRLDGSVAQAQFRSPRAMCIDSNGVIYLSDTGNNVIRKIDTNGIVSTIAGSGTPAPRDGVGTNASFWEPTGITMDRQGNLYVIDSINYGVRVITPDQVVRTLTQVGSVLYVPSIWHLKISSTDLLYFGYRSAIATLTTWGLLTPFADLGVVGVTLDSSDRVYAVSGNQLIGFDGATPRVIAGAAYGFSDGAPQTARFASTTALAIDNDRKVLVADDHCIRIVDTNGYVSTLAGAGPRGLRNGPSSVAQFQYITDVCIGKSGEIYAVDSGNHAIRKISFDRDQDTIPDPEDPAVGTDDRFVDSDGDGLSNADEFWAATNPNDPGSVLKIRATSTGSSNAIVSWPTTLRRSYVLTTSTNLSDWQAFPAISGDGFIKTVTNSTASPHAFYRLRVEP